jgi:glycosyltransferase involved in cell wall biosynthesis
MSDTALRIAFDVSQTDGRKAGCGVFAHGLIQALAEIDTNNRYEALPTWGTDFWSHDWRHVTCPASPRFSRGSGHESQPAARAFWRGPREAITARYGGFDVLHSNNFFFPSRLTGPRVVYTLYDLSFLDHPEWTTEANRVACFNGVFAAAMRADGIVSISQATTDHFLDHFPHYPRERLRVVPLASRYAADAHTPLPVDGRLAALDGKPFWLAVGTIEPRKNYERLVNAYAQHRKTTDGRAWPLVIAGGEGWMMERFRDKLTSLGLCDAVIITGYVPDLDLLWLMRHCQALVYPSLFEGFGLPVVEAMSQGVPVITSSTTSLPEVVGDAGILVDPYDESAISTALDRLAADPNLRTALGIRSRAQAARFTWRRSAEAVRDFYRETVERAPFSATA